MKLDIEEETVEEKIKNMAEEASEEDFEEENSEDDFEEETSEEDFEEDILEKDIIEDNSTDNFKEVLEEKFKEEASEEDFEEEVSEEEFEEETEEESEEAEEKSEDEPDEKSSPVSMPEKKKHRKLKTPVIVGIILAAVLALGCAAWFIIRNFFPNFSLVRGERNMTFVADDTGVHSDWTVMERVSADTDEGFSIRLPEAVAVSDIAIENHYRDRALLIRLSGVKASEFVGTYVTGNVSDITVVAWKAKDSEILVSFEMSQVWEYEVTQTGSELRIKNTAVSELYETVVVIDPVYSSVASEDITALVAESVAQKAAEQGIKVYITRGAGSERSEAERLALILDTEADYVIGLDVDSNSDTSKYGLSAVYNDRFYNPDFENAVYADILLKSVAEVAKNRANAIEAASEDSLLMLVKQPAAGIKIGYISNSEEYSLLLDESYRDTLATGILNGIVDVVSSEQ